MAVNLVQHIELQGDNPTKAVISGTNLKAYLVAQFALGWGVDEAVENYNLDHAHIHAALSFYYDNLAAIESHETETVTWLKENAINGDAKLDEFNKRRSEKNTSK
jgi:uncharacterized protein (DUF433 family)